MESFYKQSEKVWQYTVARGLDDMIHFQSIEAEIALNDLYQKVKWEDQKGEANVDI